MKKTLKYLLIAAMIVLAGAWSMVNAMPQGIATEPQIEMKSTSMMVKSGSHLPNAAETGAYTTDGEESGPPKGRPRRVGEDDGFEPEEPEPDVPGNPFPIGDAAWPLALMALIYVAIMIGRKRKA